MICAKNYITPSSSFSGDEKSMKFGAEWAEKVKDYFECDFEDIGMEKVVTALLNAYKRKDTNEDENIQKRKRIKL